MNKIEERIIELTKMGEFKTFGEAREYCKLHGLDESHTGNNCFQIAGSLMDSRKSQDKITRHACAESFGKDLNVKLMDVDAINEVCVQIERNIINTKAV